MVKNRSLKARATLVGDMVLLPPGKKGKDGKETVVDVRGSITTATIKLNKESPLKDMTAFWMLCTHQHIWACQFFFQHIPGTWGSHLSEKGKVGWNIDLMNINKYIYIYIYLYRYIHMYICMHSAVKAGDRFVEPQSCID